MSSMAARATAEGEHTVLTGLTIVKSQRRAGGHVKRPAQIEISAEGNLKVRQLNGKSSPPGKKVFCLKDADIKPLDDVSSAPASARRHLDDWSSVGAVRITLPGKRPPMFLKGIGVQDVQQLLTRKGHKEELDNSKAETEKVEESVSESIRSNDKVAEMPLGRGPNAEIEPDDSALVDNAFSSAMEIDDNSMSAADDTNQPADCQTAPPLSIKAPSPVSEAETTSHAATTTERIDVTRLEDGDHKNSGSLLRTGSIEENATADEERIISENISRQLKEISKLPGVVSAKLLNCPVELTYNIATVHVVVSHQIHARGLPPPSRTVNLSVYSETGESLRQDLAKPFSSSDDAWLDHKLTSDAAANAIQAFAKRTAPGQQWQHAASVTPEITVASTRTEQKMAIPLGTLAKEVSGFFSEESRKAEVEKRERLLQAKSTNPDISNLVGSRKSLMLEVLSLAVEEEQRIP